MKNIKSPLLYQRNNITLKYILFFSGFCDAYQTLSIHQKINFKFYQFNHFNLPYPKNLDIIDYIPTQNILS